MTYVKVEEAAKILDLSVSTMNKLRMGQQGPPFFKLGRSVRYATGDLDQWRQDRRRASTWAANDNAAESSRTAAA